MNAYIQRMRERERERANMIDGDIHKVIVSYTWAYIWVIYPYGRSSTYYEPDLGLPVNNNEWLINKLNDFIIYSLSYSYKTHTNTTD